MELFSTKYFCLTVLMRERQHVYKTKVLLWRPTCLLRLSCVCNLCHWTPFQYPKKRVYEFPLDVHVFTKNKLYAMNKNKVRKNHNVFQVLTQMVKC